MKLINKFKNLDNINKMLIVITFIIMILLIGNLIMSIEHIGQFNVVRNSGNDRWFQVENRIKLYENKVDELERIMKDLNIPR